MFDGKSLLGIKPHEINQAGVSRVFQTPEIFFDLSVFENVMISCFAKRDGGFRLNMWHGTDSQTDVRDKTSAILHDVNMDSKADMIAASLSRGDKRRLEMAMCLAQDRNCYYWTSQRRGWRGRTPQHHRITGGNPKQTAYYDGCD